MDLRGSQKPNIANEQSLKGEIAELREVVREIKGRVIEEFTMTDGIKEVPMVPHILGNIKNDISEIKRDCLDILSALSLL